MAAFMRQMDEQAHLQRKLPLNEHDRRIAGPTSARIPLDLVSVDRARANLLAIRDAADRAIALIDDPESGLEPRSILMAVRWLMSDATRAARAEARTAAAAAAAPKLHRLVVAPGTDQ